MTVEEAARILSKMYHAGKNQRQGQGDDSRSSVRHQIRQRPIALAYQRDSSPGWD